MSEENTNPAEQGGTIPVNTAVQLTANWRAYLRESGQGFQTRAFYISMKSINELMESNPDAQGIRTYIGLDDPADPTTARLMIVPVIDNHDIIYKDTANRSATASTTDTDEDDSNVYDFTLPCPKYCADDNEMNS